MWANSDGIPEHGSNQNPHIAGGFEARDLPKSQLPKYCAPVADYVLESRTELEHKRLDVVSGQLSRSQWPNDSSGRSQHDDTPSQIVQDRMQSILDLLCHPLVSTLLSLHPNTLGLSSFKIPPDWARWWHWADTELKFKPNEESAKTTVPWLLLLRFYEACRDRESSGSCCPTWSIIPEDIKEAIKGLSDTSLLRDLGRTFPPSAGSTYLPATSPSILLASRKGMSAKKAHEVSKMTAFVDTLLASSTALKHTRYAVDIGAGQAYLSRSLRDRLGLHVLALDWSDIQTQGAARKDAPKASSMSRHKGTSEQVDVVETSSYEDSNRLVASQGSLTYVTTRIDKESLLEHTHAWLEDVESCRIQSLSIPDEPTQSNKTVFAPVLLVALHACGSLTPDILRAFVAAAARSSWTGASTEHRDVSWQPQAAVIVGCCYNMMRQEDFPLSRAFGSCRGAEGFHLTSNHLQLAAQVPAEWTRTEESLQNAQLALRKVVWRAMLEESLKGHDEIQAHSPVACGDSAAGTHTVRRTRRLGRLNDSAYKSWETFVRTVRTKMDIVDLEVPEPSPEMERRIETFHTLRCIAGPAVESLILLDRLAWMQEELEGLPYKVELVNLFGQASGSGRNVAIIIRPTD